MITENVITFIQINTWSYGENQKTSWKDPSMQRHSDNSWSETKDNNLSWIHIVSACSAFDLSTQRLIDIKKN